MDGMVLLILFCAFFLGFTLFGELRKNRGLVYVAKPLASAMFLGIAYAGFDGGSGYDTLIFWGLVLGAVGDVALMFSANSAFLTGLVAFLVGHILYVVAFMEQARGVSIEWWMVILFLLLTAMILFHLRGNYGNLAVPVGAYGVVISLMVIGVWHMHKALGATNEATLLAAYGATLFYASDIAVAQDKFKKKSFFNKAWGLPAYYAGQVMIALSMHSF